VFSSGIRSLLAARLVDPLYWRVLKRSDVLRRFGEFERQQWDSADEFRARQDGLLADVLIHAKNKIPYYVARVGHIDDRDIRVDPRACLSEFPTLTRDDLRASLDQLWTDVGRGAYLNSTGGSTGVPVAFYQDRVYKDAALAATRLFYKWAGVRAGDRALKLWGAGRDIGRGWQRLSRQALEFAMNRRTLDAFMLGRDEMRSHAAAMARFRPVALEGYADALYEFARFVEEESISVPAPRCIVSSAGTLHPHMRELIARALGAPIYDRYGARDVGNVAAECGFGSGMHVHGETSLVEIVDAEGNEVSEGDVGRLLVTNLRNYSMPLIRYEVGDDAERGASRCDCGRPYPLLARVVGRTGSSFPTSEGGVVLPEFFIHVVGVEYREHGVRKFQVVQESLNEIVVKIVLDAGADTPAADVRVGLAARIKEAMGESCEVKIEFVDEIPPTATGKHLYTVSKVRD